MRAGFVDLAKLTCNKKAVSVILTAFLLLKNRDVVCRLRTV
jgi:hypothetical protein